MKPLLIVLSLFLSHTLFAEGFTKKELTLGYKIKDGQITFIFSSFEYPKEYSPKKEDTLLKKYYVSGSFNQWKIDSKEWEMEHLRNNLWILKKELKDIPKNSHFKFSNGKEILEPQWEKMPLKNTMKTHKKGLKTDSNSADLSILIIE